MTKLESKNSRDSNQRISRVSFRKTFYDNTGVTGLQFLSVSLVNVTVNFSRS